jgi:predicted nucleic acid-binding protein
MSALVVDASVAVKWVVDEEGSEAAAELAIEDLEAPDLLYVEAANVLWTKAQRRELTEAEAAERLALLLEAPLRLIPSKGLLERAQALAFELEHPVYDCVYLALALDRDTELVTADGRFVNALSAHARYKERVRLLAEPPP